MKGIKLLIFAICIAGIYACDKDSDCDDPKNQYCSTGLWNSCETRKKKGDDCHADTYDIKECNSIGLDTNMGYLTRPMSCKNGKCGFDPIPQCRMQKIEFIDNCNCRQSQTYGYSKFNMNDQDWCVDRCFGQQEITTVNNEITLTCNGQACLKQFDGYVYSPYDEAELSPDFKDKTWDIEDKCNGGVSVTCRQQERDTLKTKKCRTADLSKGYRDYFQTCTDQCFGSFQIINTKSAPSGANQFSCNGKECTEGNNIYNGEDDPSNQPDNPDQPDKPDKNDTKPDTPDKNDTKPENKTASSDCCDDMCSGSSNVCRKYWTADQCNCSCSNRCYGKLDYGNSHGEYYLDESVDGIQYYCNTTCIDPQDSNSEDSSSKSSSSSSSNMALYVGGGLAVVVVIAVVIVVIFVTMKKMKSQETHLETHLMPTEFNDDSQAKYQQPNEIQLNTVQ